MFSISLGRKVASPVMRKPSQAPDRLRKMKVGLEKRLTMACTSSLPTGRGPVAASSSSAASRRRCCTAGTRKLEAREPTMEVTLDRHTCSPVGRGAPGREAGRRESGTATTSSDTPTSTKPSHQAPTQEEAEGLGRGGWWPGEAGLRVGWWSNDSYTMAGDDDQGSIKYFLSASGNFLKRNCP